MSQAVEVRAPDRVRTIGTAEVRRSTGGAIAVDALRVVAAWLAGISGSVAAIRGWGPVVMDAAEQATGIQRIALITLVWLILARLLARRLPGAQLLAQVGAYATCTFATADNVGRAPSIVAVTGTFIAAAILVGWRPLATWPGRRVRTALLALVPFAAAQAAWAARNSLAGALLLFAVTMLVVEAYHRSWRPVVAPDRALRQVPGAVAAATSSVARRSAGAAGGAIGWARRAAGPAVARWLGARARTVGRAAAVVDRHLAAAAGIGMAVGLVFSPIFWRLTNAQPVTYFLGINDYDQHVQAARRFSLIPFRPQVPQFLFHASSAGFSVVFGDQLGPVITLTLALALTSVAVYLLCRLPEGGGRGLPFGPAATLAIGYFLLETPTLVLLMSGVLPGNTRFMSVHWLYSPTWVVAFPFGILTLVLLDRALEHPVRWTRGPTGHRRQAVVVAVVVLGVIAKPSFALCLLPGLVTYLLIFHRQRLRTTWRVAAAVIVPAAVVMAWQTWFLSTADTVLGSDKFVFAPIAGPVYGWSKAGWPFWLPLLWVVLAAWASRGRFFSERLVRLVLCCSAFAIPIFLLFKESGPRAQDGNLGVPAQMCVTILDLLAMRCVLREAVAAWPIRRRPVRPPAWLLSAGVATACFLGGGLLSYLDAVGAVHLPIRWFPLY